MTSCITESKEIRNWFDGFEIRRTWDHFQLNVKSNKLGYYGYNQESPIDDVNCLVVLRILHVNKYCSDSATQFTIFNRLLILRIYYTTRISFDLIAFVIRVRLRKRFAWRMPSVLPRVVTTLASFQGQC